MLGSIQNRVFLVGCPRSGTTLVQSLIGSHSQILSFPESHFFVSLQSSNSILRALGIASKTGKSRLSTFVQENFPNESVELSSRIYSVNCLIKKFVALLDSTTLNCGKFNWLEKTPSHLEFVELIDRTVKNVKFVHVVRSSIDVVASLHKVTNEYPDLWGGKRSVEECVERWCRSILITSRYFSDPNHIIVDYHELAQNPIKKLEDICKALGVGFEASQLADFQSKSKELITKNEPWKNRNNQPVEDRHGIGFRQHFDAEQQEKILSLLGKVDLPEGLRHLVVQ